MNMRNCKWIGLVVLIGATVCVMTYADKGEGKKMTLPAAVKSAIQAAYPQAVIEKTKMEGEFKVYEVALKQNGQESEVTITPDGTIIAVETKVAVDKIPAAVAEKMTKAEEGAKVGEIEQKITYAVVKAVKLDAPETGYEADLTKDGKKCEIKVAANGTVLEKSEWQKAEDKDEDKEGDDENEDDDEDEDNDDKGGDDDK